MADATAMEKLVPLCKRRGFIFPGSEIYDGLKGTWDYGPLGVELLRNVKNAWWQDNVTTREDIVGLDSAILMHRKVWQASGHESNFTDPLVDCKTCQTRFRADQLAESRCPRKPSKNAGAYGESGLVAVYPGFENDGIIVDVAGVAFAFFNADFTLVASILGQPGISGNRDLMEWLKKNHEKFFDLAITPLDTKSQHLVVVDILRLLQWVGGERRTPRGPGDCELTPARKFNLMFKTFVGPLEESATQVYLRPETAQGIFVNFKNVVDSSRMKVPFGIAQIGKSFRNEITPKQFIFRSREFEQMEIEFFCKPETSQEWYKTWRDGRFKWYQDLGLKSDNLRLREHGKEELAFYSIGTSDVEYNFPWGWGELEGIAHRGDYDLKQHMQFSGKDLSFFDDETKERFVPHVIEPSAGATRSVLAFLCEAYAEEMVEGESRTVLRFHPRLAPIKAAIFPLVKKEGMPERSMALYKDLQKNFNVFYDEKGAVGRRYRRQDEAGTPFCITVDGQTATDQTVTIRERDSMKQERIAVDKVKNYLFEKLGG